jgi:hypothetical protein
MSAGSNGSGLTDFTSSFHAQKARAGDLGLPLGLLLSTIFLRCFHYFSFSIGSSPKSVISCSLDDSLPVVSGTGTYSWAREAAWNVLVCEFATKMPAGFYCSNDGTYCGALDTVLGVWSSFEFE